MNKNVQTFIGCDAEYAEADELPEEVDARLGEIETAIGDLTDRKALGRALEGVDAVIHLAAYADVGIVIEDPVGAEEANSRGTLSVLQAARDAQVEQMIYKSTI